MPALELSSYDGGESLVVTERPVPRPRRGEVLVRIAATPVNPSDLLFLRGEYGVPKPLPVIPGEEGCGTVVASGGGLQARALVGRRVACFATPDRDGTWAGYTATKADLCVPLLKRVSDEQGAMLIVNPLTAWSFVDRARRGGHRSFVQTAAAGQLGRMIIRLAARRGIDVVNIVRRPEQVELLAGMGAKYVLSSADADFNEQLRELCARLGTKFAYDAVGGELTGRLIQALPAGGHVTVYGKLTEEPCRADTLELIFRGKSVDGTWMEEWFPSQSFLFRTRAAFGAQRLLDDVLTTEVRARLPLEQAREAVGAYESGMTAGKVLFLPWGSLPVDRASPARKQSTAGAD
jgi:NADPH2:quinone reductase